MTFKVFNTDESVVVYTADSWEEFVSVADLDNCYTVMVKEQWQSIE